MIAANAGSSYISVRMYVMRLVASLLRARAQRGVSLPVDPHVPVTNQGCRQTSYSAMHVRLHTHSTPAARKTRCLDNACTFSAQVRVTNHRWMHHIHAHEYHRPARCVPAASIPRMNGQTVNSVERCESCEAASSSAPSRESTSRPSWSSCSSRSSSLRRISAADTRWPCRRETPRCDGNRDNFTPLARQWGTRCGWQCCQVAWRHLAGPWYRKLGEPNNPCHSTGTEGSWCADSSVASRASWRHCRASLIGHAAVLSM